MKNINVLLVKNPDTLSLSAHCPSRQRSGCHPGRSPVHHVRKGQPYTNQHRRQRPCSRDTSHVDEVWLTLKDERHSLWRAVDQESPVLHRLGARRRYPQAAQQCLRNLLKGLPSCHKCSSRPSASALARRSGSACRVCHITSTATSTTTRRTLLSPCASGSGGCRGVNPRARARLPRRVWLDGARRSTASASAVRFRVSSSPAAKRYGGITGTRIAAYRQYASVGQSALGPLVLQRRAV
jgi:DDE domain